VKTGTIYTSLFTVKMVVSRTLDQICLSRQGCDPKARYTLAMKSTVAKTGDKSATSRLSTLSPVCRKSTVAGSFDFGDNVAVDIVAKVEHVQVCRLCRKWVIFVARMSDVLSTLSPVCTGLNGPTREEFLHCLHCWSCLR